jgi:nitroimidazol reductase NimA-like FMN-containing flavoprotein (pyridoxamine 5'-phosphate oxidase superfamily)
MPYDISLDDDELRRLTAAEHIAVLTSSNPDGSPHAVPIWPIPLADDLYVETETVSRKARNLRTRPRFCLVMGLGTWGPSAVLWGKAQEVTDPDVRRKIREITAIRYFGTTTHPSFRNIERQYEEFGGASVFRLVVDRVASWNYEKLSERDWILPDRRPR